MSDGLLMIFVKNPVPGKVKTRLAAALGNKRAAEIYEKLLHHTRSITGELNMDKMVFYADEVPAGDMWDGESYDKALQQGNELGEKMENAFRKAFGKGYTRVVIIGSDCYELNTTHLEEAFEALSNHDVVIGPASDGGYYLLGMKTLHPALFVNKSWSTNSVFEETIRDINRLALRWYELPVLNDVDTEEDLP